MWTEVAVLIARDFERYTGPAGLPLDYTPTLSPEEMRVRHIEAELCKALAPHAASTILIADGPVRQMIPNPLPSFDTWGVSYRVLDELEEAGGRINAEYWIFGDQEWILLEEDEKGFPVVAATDLIEVVYHIGAVIDPEYEYHLTFDQEGRARELLEKHRNCLAVMCTVHF